MCNDECLVAAYGVINFVTLSVCLVAARGVTNVKRCVPGRCLLCDNCVTPGVWSLGVA
jgi:hypothetical protein